MIERQSIIVFRRFAIAGVLILASMIFVNWIEREVERTDRAPWETIDESDTTKLAGFQIMKRNGCLACHRVDNFGGDIAPKLNGVSSRRSREELFKWIQSPQSLKPATSMPNFHLEDDAIQKIISYLETKK